MDICVNSDCCQFNQNVMNFGNRVIIDLGKHKCLSIILEKNQVYQTRFGALKHNDCIGKKYGSKIQTSKGFVYILPMNPVLWSECLLHRTQIIYPTDASLIVGQLELRPGKRVFESGTGSGSLTHFLVQAILPNGFVNTFDFHEERVQIAAKEFKVHSLELLVHASYRDVCADYFPPVDDKCNPYGVDAIILDLPRPWTVIPHLPRSYNPLSGGRVCTFSPCIEQIQRSCIALANAGFIRIETMECLEREYDMIRTSSDVPDLGQMNALKWLDKSLEEYVSSNLNLNHPSNLSNMSSNKPIGQIHHKRKHGMDEIVNTAADHDYDESLMQNRQEPDNIDTCGLVNVRDKTSDTCEVGKQTANKRIKKETFTENKTKTDFTWQPSIKCISRGHTGYLTFATWLPNVHPKKEELSPLETNDAETV